MNTSGSDARFIPPAAPALHHYGFACRRLKRTIAIDQSRLNRVLLLFLALPLVCGESFFSFLSPERAIRNEHFRVRRSFYSSGSTRSAPLRVCMPEGRCSDLDHRLIK
ncbi:hypothetical protein NDU88_000433 [Pleurodeles waltl]|uniref:Uncharacterized protein n=1 Tax=Pleurodeles waltl TaxID=8319 RepID=A0AAV7U4M2_PLEWA|nr:hypothetical protein NDU88_000433 [Pleurodeles waltl]